MTTLTVALLVVAGLVAVGDWVGVATGRDRWVYVFKPAVMLVVIAATLSIPDLPSSLRWLMVAGQVAGLAGDVALMLGKFLPGAAAFGVGHILFVIAWLPYAKPGLWLIIGIAAGLILMTVVGRRVTVAAAQRSTTMAQAVSIYQVLLSLMLVVAFATAQPVLAIAAALFAGSDSLLGWTRFVHENPRLRVVVHITYHLAQIGMVVALPSLVAA